MKISLSSAPILSLFLLFASLPSYANEPIAVITSRDSHLEALTPIQVKTLFLGNQSFLPNGERVELADQEKSLAIRSDFYESMFQMSLQDVSRHWARVIFTGHGRRPKQIDGGDENVKYWVKSRANGISYIYASSADSSIKVLLTIDE